MWVLLAVLCAFMLSVSDVFSKIALRRLPMEHVAWSRFAFSLPLLAALLPFSQPPDNWPLFLFYALLALPLEVAATFLYMRALQLSPLSLTVPFLSFTPVIILVSGWVLLGETPTPGGVLGVGLVSAGAYILGLGKGARGFLAPFKNFRREPGSMLMALVAVLYALTATLGKKQILLSSPLFMAGAYGAATCLGMTAALLFLKPGTRFRPLARERALWGLGLAWGAMALLHVFAISLAPAAIMMAVKRMSILFSVLFGIRFFHEGGAKTRIPGAALMLAGVFVLAW